MEYVQFYPPQQTSPTLLILDPMEHREKPQAPWQKRLHEVIFEADTPTGKLFDVVLLWAILISVLAVMLESVDYLKVEFGNLFITIEWVFTILFTVEYVARIISIRKPVKYMLSFYGLVDLLSILPTYLAFFVVGTHSLLVIRSLRMLRIFRILKVTRYVREADALTRALKASRPKIVVFLFGVLMVTVIMGTVMYIVESPEAGFTSIPRSIYWTIVTLTTVGYGDIAPQTFLGQTLASVIMIIGYGIIAVPTGIVGVEMARSARPEDVSTQSCPNCSAENHNPRAIYCFKCGAPL